MKDFLTSNGVRLCLSSPYHPASNGEAERAVRTFKEAMRVMKNEPGTQTQKLARFLLSYRTTPHTATGCPPAEILMGRRLRTRLELLRPDLSARMEKKSRRINPMVRRGFEIGEPVMVKDYRNRGSAWTKGVVQDRLGPVTYRVQVEKLLWKRHVDQLRELAGSKVADVQPNSCELPEIDLPEKVDASVSVTNQDLSPQQQSMPNEKSTKPSVEVASPGQSITLEDVTHNTVPEEPRRRSSRIRSKPKRLIEEISIVSPRRPKDLSFGEIVDDLAKHLDPKPIVIAERFKFHKAEQQESEAIRDFVARLKKLAETCEFGGYREEAIRDRFVCGLKDRTIQRKLLAVADLTLQTAIEMACAAELTETAIEMACAAELTETAIEMACAAELTEKETTALHGGSVEEIKKVAATFPECFLCGKVNHSSDTCFFRKSKCHGCQNVGHIVKKCPQKEQKPENGKNKWSAKSKFGKKKKQQKVRFVEEDLTVRQSVSGNDWPIFTVSDSRGTRKEFIVPVAINGKTVDMELDKGASVTIIPKSIWTDVLASKPVERIDVKLRSYSGHEIPVIGEARVQVAYRDQRAVLPVVITGNDGPVLMGRDWLSVLKLDWGQIKQIS
ncbi:Uncharacterized protein K02A2.6 [Stylophora pistillata]|uniref:Uncharacterized protein K02A2.6 n=1 Tax=Stylophora pistillata TaxID=50429 RepID=A0A2B4R7Y2_STYPI|nr:Uncharacterized protein K02A2.6 [Stylophora pistillata]